MDMIQNIQVAVAQTDIAIMTVLNFLRGHHGIMLAVLLGVMICVERLSRD